MNQNKNYFISKVFLLTLAVFSSLFLFSACIASSLQPPITIPFAIHKKDGKVVTEFIIKEDANYEFNLKFKYKEHDRAGYLRVRKLVGEVNLGADGDPIFPGVRTPLDIEIVQLDDPLTGGEHIISNMSGEVFKLTSWGFGAFTKEITRISLMPGRYRAIIASKAEVPALEGTSVEFEVRRFFKK